MEIFWPIHNMRAHANMKPARGRQKARKIVVRLFKLMVSHKQLKMRIIKGSTRQPY